MPDKRIARIMKDLAGIKTSQLDKDLKSESKDFKAALKDGDFLEAAFQVFPIAVENTVYRGHRDLLDDKPSGWAQIQKFATQLTVSSAIYGIKGGSPASQVGEALFFLIATGKKFVVEFGADALELYLTKGHDRADQDTCRFAYWCAQRFLGRKPKAGIALKKPYIKAAAAFDSGLTPKLRDELVEYHLNNMGILEKDGVDYLTVNLIPVEFFAMSHLMGGNPEASIEGDVEFFSTPFAKLDKSALTYDPEKDDVLKPLLELGVKQKALEPGFLKKLKA